MSTLATTTGQAEHLLAQRDLCANPYSLANLDLSLDDLDRLVAQNPSLRSFLIGYAAEHHLQASLADLGITDLGKPDDHDRTNKGDRLIEYEGEHFRLESKSLQSTSVAAAGDTLKARAQIDASDRRDLELPNGETVATVCLLRSDLDVVAINLYAFTYTWEFAYIDAADLPICKARHLTHEQRRYLIATSVSVTYPLQAPFSRSLPEILTRIASRRR